MKKNNQKDNLGDLKKEVMELLNQIVVLTKGIKEPQQRENYNYQLEYITEEVLHEMKYDIDEEDEITDYEGKPVKDVNDDAVYLFCVGQYAKRVIDGDADSAVHNENQYYNSNC